MAEVGFEGSGCCGGQVHLQGSTHKEMLLPVGLVVDGAPTQTPCRSRSEFWHGQGGGCRVRGT